MHRVPTKRQSYRVRSTWQEYAFVFGGIAVAVAASGLGAGEEILAPVWLGVIGWTALANIAHALWRGFRFGGWSTFKDHGPLLPETPCGLDDFTTRQLTDPAFRHLPGNVHYSFTDDSARLFTDPAYSCVPGNVHYHPSSD